MPTGSLLYALIGLLAGLASGCFGIGGGALVVPALTLLCGVPYHVAVGTSLALIIPITFAGSPGNSTRSTGKSPPPVP